MAIDAICCDNVLLGMVHNADHIPVGHLENVVHLAGGGVEAVQLMVLRYRVYKIPFR